MLWEEDELGHNQTSCIANGAKQYGSHAPEIVAMAEYFLGI